MVVKSWVEDCLPRESVKAAESDSSDSECPTSWAQALHTAELMRCFALDFTPAKIKGLEAHRF